MKTLIVLLSLFSQYVYASTLATPLIDYLRETPASIGGSIALDQDFDLYSGKKGILSVGMKINSKKPIQYSFSEDYLSINSYEGMSLTIAGFSFNVKSIYYNGKSGKFKVKTSTPLDIGAASLNSQIEEVLNEQYRPKMMKAFEELKTLRSKQSLRDVNEVIGSISRIFSTSSSTPLPTIRGSASLIFRPSVKKNLRIDTWKAQIEGGDYLSLGMDFTKTPQNLKVNGLSFSSQQGIRISGKTDFPEINSMLFKSMEANGRGISFNYDLGAEEVVTGFKILIGTIQAVSGSPHNLLKECNPVRLEGIRRMIDQNLRREIAEMIRIHRRSLLNAGASPQLLAALD